MIIVKGLNFSYKEKQILHDLNFKINPGTWVSIIGDNGSGKSTLVKILISLLQYQKGQIMINGLELNENNLSDIRPLMGIVFQNPDYQFIGFDVRSDIAFGLENQNLPREEMQQKIFEVSRSLGIYDLLDKKPQELSGGQKQKVAIASVLALEPEIIIFDEPTAFLDPQGVKEIHNIIKNIHQQKNKILITITHDLSFALQSDEIIILEKGHLLKHDKPANFIKEPSFLEKYFVNLPLSLKLYYELLKKDENLSHEKTESLQKIKEILWQYSLKM
ncbi:MAG: ABC-type cobalt transport system, ATPase component [Candidatus Phytoplasma pruni]|uniref:energy-coupling factor transporter ATPase n=1 Tax=Poinsettia branch-inducing phytoplasma TaxID=138647 RepID=UPI0003652CCF|nr:energy-coupling factor transporter ATPase [Poinsettia branch-inducing phytoplasma]WEK82400.1 MAG: ABC-type cobalt transport system, ATPase component [Candidatus Phytoplasma pruni]